MIRIVQSNGDAPADDGQVEYDLALPGVRALQPDEVSADADGRDPDGFIDYEAERPLTPEHDHVLKQQLRVIMLGEVVEGAAYMIGSTQYGEVGISSTPEGWQFELKNWPPGSTSHITVDTAGVITEAYSENRGHSRVELLYPASTVDEILRHLS